MIQEGQLVICIDAKPLEGQPKLLKEGVKYLVQGIHTCSCGKYWVDVGFCDSRHDDYICTCSVIHNNDGTFWFMPRRFAQISVNQEHVEAIEKIKQEIIHQN